jgi:hypothetical protein
MPTEVDQLEVSWWPGRQSPPLLTLFGGFGGGGATWTNKVKVGHILAGGAQAPQIGRSGRPGDNSDHLDLIGLGRPRHSSQPTQTLLGWDRTRTRPLRC